MTRQMLDEIVAGTDKRRFELHGGRIRAAQGHPIPVDRQHQDGFAFYRAANGVWLTEDVPPERIGFPDDEAVSLAGPGMTHPVAVCTPWCWRSCWPGAPT